MTHHVADTAFLLSAQKRRRKVQTDHTAGLRDRTDHIVRKISLMTGNRAGIGMGGQERPFAVLLHIPETIVGQMRDIHKNAKTVHLLHRLNSQRFQTALISVGNSKCVFIIPGQSNQAYPKIKNLLHIGKILPADTSVLDGQQKARLFLPEALLHLFRTPHRQQAIRILADNRLPHLLISQKRFHTLLVSHLRRKHSGGHKRRAALHPNPRLFQSFQINHMAVFLKTLFFRFQHCKRITVKINNIHSFLPPDASALSSKLIRKFTSGLFSSPIYAPRQPFSSVFSVTSIILPQTEPEKQSLCRRDETAG